MHILYLHQYFVPPDGSGGTRSFEMARRFVNAGHEVTFVTSNAFFPNNYLFNKKATTLTIDGITLRVIKVPYSNKLSFLRRILAFGTFALKSITEVLKIKNVDIVYATSTPLTIAFPAFTAKIFHKAPLVFEVRDLWPELPVAVGVIKNSLLIWLLKLFEKIVYTQSAHVVALSPGMKEGIIQTGYSDKNITVIPNSCDINVFRNVKSPSEKILNSIPFRLNNHRIVTYAGTFGLINGTWYLVDIAEKMLRIDPEVKFLLIGDGKESGIINNRINSANILGKNIWIMPPIMKKELAQILSITTVATSLVIDIPAIWNNSANKFFDAIAAGRPLMINYEGWQAEILRETGAGIIVPPNNPQKAADLLYEFIYNDVLLEKAKAACINLADNKFNRDKLANQLLNVLLKVKNNSEI